MNPILDVLEYVFLAFFGHILLSITLIACTLIVRTKLSEFIATLKTASVIKDSPTDSKDRATEILPRVLSIEAKTPVKESEKSDKSLLNDLRNAQEKNHET
jgi:hypothetical protein